MKPVEPEAQPTLNPSGLYRQTFVGRDAEVRQLQAIFDGVAVGQAALVAVLGEPGIGKTSLCEQLAVYATERAARTLVGHCYEAGSLSLPYLPFVEALRSYVLDRDVESLMAELAAGSADVARLVPELRDPAPMPERPASDPEQERWRLLKIRHRFPPQCQTGPAARDRAGGPARRRPRHTGPVGLFES